jgi:RND family efflux transporter MFP subunit
MSRLASIALALVVSVLPAACHTASSAEIPDKDEGANTPVDWRTLSYATVGPVAPHWTDDIPARITFDEQHTSRVGTPLGGRVTAVYAELGQHVKAGDKLFAVTSSDLGDLRSALAKAEVDLTASEANYTRVKTLVDTVSLPKKELVAAEQDLEESKLAKTTAEQKLTSLRVGGTGDSGFVLTAPRSGVIVEKTLAAGQQVSPDNGSLIAIADLSHVWVVADVLEDAVGTMKVGGKAQVTVDGIDQPLAGPITQVSAVVDPDRHTVPIRVELDNSSGQLRPNSYAQVRFYDDGGTALAVPSSAVITDGTAQYVYMLGSGNVIARREVVASPPSAGIRSIRSGLAAGDKIVAEGNQLLENQLPAEPGSGSGGGVEGKQP